MLKLFTEEEVSYHGRWVNFDGITLLPRPVQKPYPPLSFGGGSTVQPVYADDPKYQPAKANLERVFRRIARYASAWQATSTSEPGLLERDWEEIAKYAREYGRDPREIEWMQTTYLIISDDLDEVRRLYGRIVGKDFDAFLQFSSYLYGEPDKIVAELKRREAMGIDRMILTPVKVDVDELDEWDRLILRPFRQASTGA